MLRPFRRWREIPSTRSVPARAWRFVVGPKDPSGGGLERGILGLPSEGAAMSDISRRMASEVEVLFSAWEQDPAVDAAIVYHVASADGPELSVRTLRCDGQALSPERVEAMLIEAWSHPSLGWCAPVPSGGREAAVLPMRWHTSLLGLAVVWPHAGAEIPDHWTEQVGRLTRSLTGLVLTQDPPELDTLLTEVPPSCSDQDQTEAPELHWERSQTRLPPGAVISDELPDRLLEDYFPLF